MLVPTYIAMIQELKPSPKVGKGMVHKPILGNGSLFIGIAIEVIDRFGFQM